MLGRIASFELRQQVTGHVFWVVAAISTLMVLGSIGVDALRVGVAVDGLRNGAEAVVVTHLVWTLFFMFTSAAFVADAMLRDELVGFAPVIDALPVHWRDLVYGRFAGAFAALLLCFLSVPLGVLLGPVLPWVAEDSVAPSSPLAATAFAFGIMALPNLLLSASIGFALATLTRSMGAALIGAIVLLLAYGLGERSGAILPPVFEPFGFAAYAEAVAGWTAGARDTRVPPLEGALLANRLLVLAVSALLLAAAGSRPRRATAKKAKEPISSPDPAPLRPLPLLHQAVPRFDRWTAWRQGIARTRFEFAQVVRTPVFAALLLLGLGNALATIWPLRMEADAAEVVRALSEATRLAPIVIALFFAGELRWREQERGIAGLLGATPMAESAYVLPKFAALAAILLGFVAACATAALVPLSLAGRPGAAELIPLWLFSAAWDTLIFAALALFLQALAPSKLAGWGFTILYLIASLTLDRLGLADPDWRYGRYPGWPLPSMVSDAAATWPWRLGWSIVATLLLAAALRLVGLRFRAGP